MLTAAETAPAGAMSLLAAAYENHQNALLDYVQNHGVGWPDAEDVAQEVWQAALEAADPTDTTPDADSGLPSWLARIARAALRCHLSPATHDEIEILVGFRGNEEILAAAADRPTPPCRTNALAFAIGHGDPADWTSADIETQQCLAAIDSHESNDQPPAPATHKPIVLVPAA